MEVNPLNEPQTGNTVDRVGHHWDAASVSGYLQVFILPYIMPTQHTTD